ncbi:MAG TPA: hypothetical protein VL443_09115 [Cyclobacteriaceae bacterium]|jgi:hypothetical protein|nr:hypothetical protein [Cyclobacteriaceae bacterium]
MHFFIDHTVLSNQDQSFSFGPDTSNSTVKYNLTSQFAITTNAKAFACQNGLLIVQQSKINSSLVNVIIKPLNPILSSNLKVAYFIYRGVSKSSLITTDGAGIVSKNASTNNELISRIYNADSTKTNYVSGYLGYDNNNTYSDSQHIDKIFYSKDTVKPVKVNEGEWFGDFVSGTIGFEIVLESDKLNINLELVRGGNTSTGTTVIDVSSLTDSFSIRTQREQILGFIDPAAFFGLHYNSGIIVSTYSGTTKTNTSLKGQNLFNTIISKYYTNNCVYVDIRSERGYSYNFYNNYSDGSNNNIQVGRAQNSLTAQNYSTNSWPILIITNGQSTSLTSNSVWLELRIDDNDNPLLYSLNIGGKASTFSKIYTTNVKTWSKGFNYTFPNTGSGGTKQNVATYIKSYYFRKQTATVPPTSVLRTQKYYHSAFCPIDLPNIGDTTINYFKVENPNISLIDEPLQNTTGTGGFTYAANNKVLWDANRVLFYSNFLLGSESSEKKFLPINNSQKLTCIKTNSDDVIKNLDIICRLYQKQISDTQQTNIQIIGVNKYAVPQSPDKESALFLGISTNEFNALKTATGLSNNSHIYIYLQRNTTNALRDMGNATGNRFYEYKVMLQGLDSSGVATTITPTIVRNTGDSPEPVLVYSRDNLFFNSIDFGAAEVLTSGANQVEFHTGTDGKTKVNDNIDLCLIAQDQKIHFIYNNVEIAQFDCELSSKMQKGQKLLNNNKLDIPPTNYLLSQDYTTFNVDAKKSYKNTAGDVLTYGKYGADTNYQVLYKSLHKRDVVVHFDLNTVMNGVHNALVINYNNQTVHFTYTATQRRYARAEVAAAVIGVLIEVGVDQQCGGFSFVDGTCFPSISHVNGNAVDFAYHTDNTTNQNIIDAMDKYGFGQIIIGTAARFNSLTGASLREADHNSHIHGGSLRNP